MPDPIDTNTYILNNRALVFHLVKKYGAFGELAGLDKDEVRSLAYEVIWRAVMDNDETRGSVSTLAHLMLWSRLNNIRCSRVARQKHGRVSSFMENDRGVIQCGSAEDHNLKRIDDAEEVSNILECLSPRERQVVQQHVMNGDPMEEIGLRMNITKQRVGQIKDMALSKCRKTRI